MVDMAIFVSIFYGLCVLLHKNCLFYLHEILPSFCYSFSKNLAKYLDNISVFMYNTVLPYIICVHYAGLAQLVEQLPCKQQAGGSSPLTSSIFLVFECNQIFSFVLVTESWF